MSSDSEVEDTPVYNICRSLENAKRLFTNAQFDDFRQEIKSAPFSLYRGTYQYASDNDGKPAFIAKNLLTGFVRGLEDVRKYVYGAFKCVATDTGYVYPSVLIINCNEIVGDVDHNYVKVDDIDAFLDEFIAWKTDENCLGIKYIQ
jgi:hypothetical protein